MTINMKHYFDGLNDYYEYLDQNNIFDILEIDKNSIDKDALTKKLVPDPYFSVDPNKTIPFPPELDDLCRLHYLARKRKVTTVLEFGIGKSTYIFNDALEKNEKEYGAYVKDNLRRTNPFELHAIDNSQDWINSVKSNAKNSLSKNTDILIVGDNPGLKLKKAKNLGVNIIDKKRLLTLLNYEDI